MTEQELRERLTQQGEQLIHNYQQRVDRVISSEQLRKDITFFVDKIVALIKEAGYRLPAGKAPLLTDEQLLGIRAKINGTSNVIKFARSVSKLTSQAQNNADHKFYTGVKE